MRDNRDPEQFKIAAARQIIDRGDSVSGMATRPDITPVLPGYRFTRIKKSGLALTLIKKSNQEKSMA